MMSEELLAVDDLDITFGSGSKRVHAVDGVSLRIAAGEVVGLVGESGSGKSTIGRAVLGLTEATAGTIRFEGHDITHRTNRDRRALATRMQVVFQDPLSSLNPRWTIGRSVTEPLRLHRKMRAVDAETEAIRVLGLVGLSPHIAARLPRELSGGQRQRVAIARSMVLSPRLIVCDEPTSALDLSTQSQTLNMLREVHQATGVSYLFISHDLDVVRYLSDRIIVLYRGQIMETGATLDVADAPLHPYTRALVGASPIPDPRVQTERRERRRVQLGGSTAATTGLVRTGTSGAGCPFAARCPHAADVCHGTRPRMVQVGTSNVACHLYDAASGHPDAAATPLPAAQQEIAR